MDRALRGRWGRDLGESLHAVVALVGLVEARLYPVFVPGGTGTCIPSMGALRNFSCFELCYAAPGGQSWSFFLFFSFSLQTRDVQQWPNKDHRRSQFSQSDSDSLWGTGNLRLLSRLGATEELAAAGMGVL